MALTNQNGPRLGAVLEVRIGPADVGARVSLRRRLRDGRSGLGDVVGELLSWQDGALVVRPRTGPDVRVDEADVVAAKRVPPAPQRPVRERP